MSRKSGELLSIFEIPRSSFLLTFNCLPILTNNQTIENDNTIIMLLCDNFTDYIQQAYIHKSAKELSLAQLTIMCSVDYIYAFIYTFNICNIDKQSTKSQIIIVIV